MTVDPYLIPGTATLRNRRGITDPEELRRVEEDVSAFRLRQLVDGAVRVHGRWDLAHLQRVHRHLFGDLYEWAGQVRTIEMWKATDHHPLPNPEHVRTIFGRLAQDGHLRGLERSAFITKVSQLQADLFAVHPFREGNTRSTTLFVRLLAREAGWNVEWLKAPVAGVQVLLRAAYEAPEREAGRVLEPLFDSITSPAAFEAQGAVTGASPRRDQALQWEDEARALHRGQTPSLADGDNDGSLVRGANRGADVGFDGS